MSSKSDSGTDTRGKPGSLPSTPSTNTPGSRTPGTLLRSIVGPSAPLDVTIEDFLQVVRTKLDLARAYLCLAGGAGGSREEVILAEAELSGVEGMCKGVIKGWEARLGQTKREGNERVRIGDGEGAKKGDGAGDGGTKGDGEGTGKGEGEGWWAGEIVKDLKGVRVEALKELVKVEDGLGRTGRAERWRNLISDLEGENVGRGETIQ